MGVQAKAQAQARKDSRHKQQVFKRCARHRLPVRKPTSRKLTRLGPWHEEVFIKFIATRIEGRGKDPGVRRVINMERNLVW